MTWTAFVDFATRHWLTVGFGLALTALTAAVRTLFRRIRHERGTDKAMRGGVLALLADRLVQFYHYHAERGFCPHYARASAEAMYTAYHNLGGNGAITDLYEAIKQMPLAKKEDTQHGSKQA